MASEGAYSIERVFREVREVLPVPFSVDVVHCPTPYHSRWWLFNGFKSARAANADINHVTGDIHYVVLGLPSRSTILTVHDLNHLDDLTGLRKQIYSLLYFRLPLRRCRAVTVISDATQQRLLQLFPFTASKTRVIPDCIPAAFVSRPKPFDEKHPRILQIGTKPNKNLERLGRALRGVPCVLHVIGQLNDSQRRLLAELNIHYENNAALSDSEVVRAYEQADIVAYVSLAEGFGMPVLEAQAVGRPLITSALSPMKEIAGEYACVIDPYNVAEIRSGILRLIQDPEYRETVIEKGLTNVERFSRKAVARQYAELYEEVLA